MGDEPATGGWGVEQLVDRMSTGHADHARVVGDASDALKQLEERSGSGGREHRFRGGLGQMGGDRSTGLGRGGVDGRSAAVGCVGLDTQPETGGFGDPRPARLELPRVSKMANA